MAPAGGSRRERVIHLLICIAAYAVDESSSADGREVSAAHGQRRHGISTGLGEFVDGTLSQDKEKGLVPAMIELWNHHRPTQCATEVIRAGHRATPASKKIGTVTFRQMIDKPGCSIESFILQEFVGSAVQGVGAALGADIDLAARAGALGRTKPGSHHLEFLDCIRRRNVSHYAVLYTGLKPCVGHSIQAE